MDERREFPVRGGVTRAWVCVGLGAGSKPARARGGPAGSLPGVDVGDISGPQWRRCGASVRRYGGTVGQVVMFTDQAANSWSLSRPLLSVMLASEIARPDVSQRYLVGRSWLSLAPRSRSTTLR